MAKIPETPEQWAEYYTKKEAAAEEKYQLTGERRYYREKVTAGDAAEAFRAKAREMNERDYKLEKRLNNIDAFCERLEDREYSKKEVIKLLKETAWL